MQISEFRQLAAQHQVKQVRFIESSCSPLVVELHYGQSTPKKDLLKNDQGEVVAFKNISQAYELCRDAGIHEAELVQIIPHDEACAGSYNSYDQPSMALKF